MEEQREGQQPRDAGEQEAREKADHEGLEEGGEVRDEPPHEDAPEEQGPTAPQAGL